MAARADAEARPVRQLAALADADPVFRDLYLARARTLLGPVLAEAEYERLRLAPLQIERGLHEIRHAATARDWSRVKELVTFVAGLRQALGAREGLLHLGDAVYGGRRIALDPFSRLTRGNGDMRALRERVIADLESLARHDAEWRDFYEVRHRHFGNLSPGGGAAAIEATETRPDAIEEAALAAAERGEVDRLASLLDALMDGAAGIRTALGPAVAPKVRRSGIADHGGPFADDVVRRAAGVGLRAFALRRYVRVGAVVRDGVRHGAASCAGAAPAGGGPLFRPGLPAPFRDVLGVFGRQRVVTSAGTLYNPVLGRECVLVEDFAEGESERLEVSGLIESLRLARRWGISRDVLEARLERLGPSVIRDVLGLDPFEYRLVCVPFDVYVRAGVRQGWGRCPRWTHFDGYQLLRDGTARALVGGDVRYGGVYDLCSIDRSDERPGVLVRLAVVRRLRFRSASD